MIYQGTLLRVIDNSGVRYGTCIKVLHKRPTCRARLGDKVIIAAKIVIPDRKIKKKDILKALIVRDSNQVYRKEGSYMRFTKAACVVLRRDGTPLAKRILGPVSKELRKMGHIKIISISSLAL
jgi:large subunit ribosomal protein L14